MKALSSNGYQVLFSTHSPMMIGREAICDTRLVRVNEADHIVPLAFSGVPVIAEIRSAGNRAAHRRSQGRMERRLMRRAYVDRCLFINSFIENER